MKIQDLYVMHTMHTSSIQTVSGMIIDCSKLLLKFRPETWFVRLLLNGWKRWYDLDYSAYNVSKGNLYLS